MEEIAISKFKATCLKVLARVGKTRKPIRVTRFGKPIAEIVPPSVTPAKHRKLGGMEGTIEILGDIVGPTSGPEDWEVLRS
jgi:antitoxin (DNA-binding transcriptional repressor) of toxin-antitoxin stability system